MNGGMRHLTPTRRVGRYLVLGALCIAVGGGIGYLANGPPPSGDAAASTGPGSIIKEPSRDSGGADKAQPSVERKQHGEVKDAPESRRSQLITDGVTLQILNGTRSGRAGRQMLSRLSSLGYHILVVNTAARRYHRTTVFWTSGADKKPAVALARHFVWRARPAPNNLSATVTTHVVVGRNAF